MEPSRSQELIIVGAIVLLALETDTIARMANATRAAMKQGSSSNSGLTDAEKQQIKKNAGGVDPKPDGSCPANYTNLGGICIPNSVLGQI